ncbi:MAG: hypothetical protein QOE70_6363 [Chthoniobacter sp.]|jgi:hypothetical protein|nr:hypothetical protein [Chthoniobacter sp.]
MFASSGLITALCGVPFGVGSHALPVSMTP